MCVFCRKSFTTARQYITHTIKCDSRLEPAKTSFVKNRRVQLHHVAAVRMAEKSSRKRRNKARNYLERHRKRQRENTAREADQPHQVDVLSAPSLICFTSMSSMEGPETSGRSPTPLLPTVVPSMFGSVDMPATSNNGFTSIPLNTDMACSSWPHQGEWAPIFSSDHTIPPLLPPLFRR